MNDYPPEPNSPESALNPEETLVQNWQNRSFAAIHDQFAHHNADGYPAHLRLMVALGGGYPQTIDYLYMTQGLANEQAVRLFLTQYQMEERFLALIAELSAPELWRYALNLINHQPNAATLNLWLNLCQDEVYIDEFLAKITVWQNEGQNLMCGSLLIFLHQLAIKYDADQYDQFMTILGVQWRHRNNIFDCARFYYIAGLADMVAPMRLPTRLYPELSAPMTLAPFFGLYGEETTESKGNFGTKLGEFLAGDADFQSIPAIRNIQEFQATTHLRPLVIYCHAQQLSAFCADFAQQDNFYYEPSLMDMHENDAILLAHLTQQGTDAKLCHQIIEHYARTVAGTVLFAYAKGLRPIFINPLDAINGDFWRILGGDIYYLDAGDLMPKPQIIQEYYQLGSYSPNPIAQIGQRNFGGAPLLAYHNGDIAAILAHRWECMEHIMEYHGCCSPLKIEQLWHGLNAVQCAELWRKHGQKLWGVWLQKNELKQGIRAGNRAE